ncbi:hypothetical protein MYX82_07560 [Acidobacteria bacterium AH-259-D05]|nr:hypothetical protein [Acidobacteria bacterium AH-259-D05]
MRRLWIICLAVGFVLLLSVLSLYGLWLNRLGAAEESFADSRYQEAQERFQRVWSAWELHFLPSALVAENRARLALNLIQVGYVLGEYDETLQLLRNEMSLAALVEKPQYHFWVANLLMAQALNSADTNLIDVLTRSREKYLQTLLQDPEYWDAKYNYEYVDMLLTRLQADDADAEDEMKLLLEKMRTDMPRRKIILPPEKRK